MKLSVARLPYELTNKDVSALWHPYDRDVVESKRISRGQAGSGQACSRSRDSKIRALERFAVARPRRCALTSRFDERGISERPARRNSRDQWDHAIERASFGERNQNPHG